jgi:hypothetical protein
MGPIKNRFVTLMHEFTANFQLKSRYSSYQELAQNEIE